MTRMRFPSSLPRAAAAALVLALLAGLPAAGQDRPAATRADALSYPPLPEFDPPQPQRVVLDNGMVVMLLEDHELPLVDAVALVRTGGRLEPADKVGLANLTGEVLRTGGTGSMSPDEINSFLENKAASIETSIGTTSGSASMSALAKDLPEVLAVFADVLRDPAFAEDQLEVAKAAEIAGIARQNDDPQSIAFREFSDIVYGEGSPYARDPTYASIGGIGRDDLVAWHARYFHPERVILGLVGDFDSARALELVRKEFGDWERGPGAADPDVAVAATPSPGVYFVDKDDMTQSNILIGHLGIRKDHPDYYAVEVVNNVLSGGFASRLFSNVRSKKGLAYAVFGSVGSNYDYPGLVQLFTTTKTETTAAAIDALLEEAKALRTNPPTEAEIARSKQAILNSFVFESDSNRKILNQQLRYEYYGYPLDWLERYQKGIESVTEEQVRAAAAAHVHPDRFSILVVGPGEGMDAPLSKYGEVRDVDITIPEPPVERAEVTAEGAERAGELLDRAVAAMGGAGRVDAVRSLRVAGTAKQVTPQGMMEVDVATTHLFPDRFRQEVTLPFGTMTMVLAEGGAGFVVTPQGVMDLPPSQIAALRSASRRDPLALLRRRGIPGLVATALPSVELDGTPLERLQLELEGEVTLVDLDPESGEIRRISYRDAGPTGQPGETVRIYTDYREVDGGLRYPFAVVGSFEGEQSFEATVGQVEVDPEVDEATFERPDEE